MQAILFHCYQTLVILAFVLLHIRITKIIEQKSHTFFMTFASTSLLIYSLAAIYFVFGNRISVHGGIELNVFRGLRAFVGLIVEGCRSITSFVAKGTWYGIAYCDYNLAILNESVANIILFMPFGYLLPCLLGIKRRWLFGIAWFSLSVSLSFELIQLITKLGKFDIDDLINNTLGSIVGYALYFKEIFQYSHNERTST